MDERKWNIKPIWAERYMALSVNGHTRGLVIGRQFGDAKRLFPHSFILAGILSDHIKSVEMRATDEEPQVVMYVTYGNGELLLGDVRSDIVPQMKQWVADVNDLIVDARLRQERKKGLTP